MPADGEIHKQPIYWFWIWPLMLHPGPVSMTVLSQHCAEYSPKEYDDLTLIFSQQFSSHFCLPRSPFHRETLQAILPHPFLSEFLWTHHSLLPSQGFLASTVTPFPSSISSPLLLASATSGCPEPSAFLPSHLTCQEGAPWCLQLIASSHCLSWALISGPSTPLLSIPVPPPAEQSEKL